MEIQVEQQIKDAAVEVFQKAGLTDGSDGETDLSC